MALQFPINPTLNQAYQSGSSATYQWNGTYWQTVLPTIQTVVAATSASFAASASFATSASYLDGALPTLVQAQNNSGQSIGNNVTNPSTTVTGWTNMYTQNAAEWNATAGVFTATKAGTYLVSSNLTYAAKAAAQTANVVNVQVVKNSTAQAVSTMAAINTTATLKGTGTATSVVNVAAGDTITIRTYQILGSAALLDSTTGLNNITIQEIPSRITR